MQHRFTVSSLSEHVGACSGNLQVVQEATVSKVLLEGSIAVGVEYLVGGDSAKPQVVLAAKEVLLSAGAYSSPKILMVRTHATWPKVNAFVHRITGY